MSLIPCQELKTSLVFFQSKFECSTCTTEREREREREREGEGEREKDRKRKRERETYHTCGLTVSFWYFQGTVL